MSLRRHLAEHPRVRLLPAVRRAASAKRPRLCVRLGVRIRRRAKVPATVFRSESRLGIDSYCGFAFFTIPPFAAMGARGVVWSGLLGVVVALPTAGAETCAAGN